MPRTAQAKKSKAAITFFRRGSLVFEKSGHILTKSGKYYICSLKCKKACNNASEQLMPTDDLERNFSYQAKKFAIPEVDARRLSEKLIAMNGQVFTWILQKASGSHEVLESTLNCLKQDLCKKGSIKPQDKKIFQKAYSEYLKAIYPVSLFGLLFGAVNALAMPDKEREMGLTLSTLTKKTYLSDLGKILKIELEEFGVYILEYLKKEIPGYAPKPGMLVDKKIVFPSLDFLKVMEQFKEDGYVYALKYSSLRSKYAHNKLVKTLFREIKSLPPKEVVNRFDRFLSDINVYKFMPISQILNQAQLDNIGKAIKAW